MAKKNNDPAVVGTWTAANGKTLELLSFRYGILAYARKKWGDLSKDLPTFQIKVFGGDTIDVPHDDETIQDADEETQTLYKQIKRFNQHVRSKSLTELNKAILLNGIKVPSLDKWLPDFESETGLKVDKDDREALLTHYLAWEIITDPVAEYASLQNAIMDQFPAFQREVKDTQDSFRDSVEGNGRNGHAAEPTGDQQGQLVT